ncbi:MAG: RnfH family protein [Xanthomonadales bacterium]|nr:RnfH family protein [Xanthomonadales bacterium]
MLDDKLGNMSAEMPKFFVEIAYARPDKQLIRSLEVSQGTTLAEAIELSGIVEDFPEIRWDTKNVGVFSQKKPLNYVLQENDRIEIYRPLIIDPMEARRLKAEKQKAR